jgi:Tfp pilus assembly protein PilF
MEIFYKEPQKFDDVVDAFSKVLQVYPEDKVSREFLAECYAQNKLWHNAVAYYEQVEEPICIDLASWYFFMGWAYGKCKEHDREIECYRECIKVDGDYEFARNNLGYAYYQIGKYAEAEKIFLECIKQENNLSYACRNLFLTYIAEGKWDKIEKFEKISKFKMNKFIRDRYEKAKKRYCKTSVDACFDESEEDCDDETTNKSLAGNNTIANSEQFSSEKILEDELTLRLESGQNIFGLDLKIYRRKGIYGRQFILPGDGRRLDLLAEDMSGNLYVIELKKDSGYDDAYEQTAAYIEWVERNMPLNGKHVYGIICLNNPLEILKRKIKKDKRIRLFEYQIAYTEIK